MEMASAFTLNVRLDNIAIITIDVPDEKMNTLKAEFASQVRAIIKQLRENKELRGVVFISAKPDNFIAGADINMIGNCKTAQEAEALARQGQQLMAEIHALPIPVIAAIHGACLGGGLELALACHGRVCTDDPKTVLGLSEVQLGLLPGSGGTQRLPRLIGVSTALEMILTGKQLRAKQALKLGLVDDVVPHSILLEAAVELAKKDRPSSRPLPVRERILAGPLGRALLFKMVGKKTEHKTQGNYPATERILEVVETGLAQGINHALKYSWDQLEGKVRRRHLKASERDKQLALISGTTDYRGFAHRDLIIEAVFENLELKQQMVAEVEQNCAAHTIFASNTSSLPIGDIAAHAARPEQVIGLHFFSPVEKMPLVEIIPHAGTSAQTIATTVKLAKKQGKTPIVVRDKAGFYVNRILAPYINEAIRMLTEGERVEHIDAALVKFGFPVGPIQLLDEVGIDTGTKIIPVLEAAYGERFSAPANVVSSILNDDRKGRKNGRGFYLYGQKGRKSKKQVDPAIYPLIGAQGQG